MEVSRLAARAMALGVLISAACLLHAAEAPKQNTEQYRTWIAEMKESARGPFSGIKWYCKDGTVFPPTEYACAKRGGGVQHGEWSDRTKELRSHGYRVATLLAGIDASKAVAAADFADSYAQLLVEKFLVATDNGWIMRRAQFYRGALQEEDEREGARNLLQAMAARPEWIGFRFVALRTGVRMLPHGQDTASAQFGADPATHWPVPVLHVSVPLQKSPSSQSPLSSQTTSGGVKSTVSSGRLATVVASAESNCHESVPAPGVTSTQPRFAAPRDQAATLLVTSTV